METISFKEEPVYPHQRLTNNLNSSLYNTAKSYTYFEKIKLITLRLDKYSQLSRFSIYQLQRRQGGLQCLVSQNCKKFLKHSSRDSRSKFCDFHIWFDVIPHSMAPMQNGHSVTVLKINIRVNDAEVTVYLKLLSILTLSKFETNSN